jgi:predicted RNA-binding protein with PUA domain
MAKFQEVFEDTQKLFTTHINSIDSLTEIQIKVLGNNKLKEIGKVVKANDLLKHLAGEDVVVLLNEAIFEQLDDEQKVMVVEELIAPIHFDAEKDKLTLTAPDVKTFSLFLRKYGYAKYEVLTESIRTLLTKEGEEEA